jgi:hypothetical protein
MSATERIGARTIDPSTLGERPEDADLVLQARALLNQIAGDERLPMERAPDEETREAIERFQESEGLPPTGELDRTTFEALEHRAARAVEARAAYDAMEAEGRGCVAAGLPGGVDADAGVGVDASGRATGTVCLDSAERVTLDLALEDLAVAGGAFARDVLVSAPQRVVYEGLVREAADGILREVAAGRMTPGEGAAEAYVLRNAIRMSVRADTTPLATAWAEAAARHRNFAGLMDYNAQELFGRSANELSAAEREAVFVRVIERSGATREAATADAAAWSRAGRALLVVAIAMSVYHVVTAEDMTAALGEEAAGWLGGMAGWAAGSYAGAVFCGEGAPVCVGVIATLGAVAGDMGSRRLFEAAIAPAEEAP